MKRWSGWLLIAFALASILVLVAKERSRAADATISRRSYASDRRVVVYYLYDSTRCAKCRLIEAYTSEAVNGLKVDWRPLNTDLPSNAAYVRDYSLIAKSVIVSEQAGGKEIRWKNLDRIWDLTGEKKAFIAYILREVREYLR